MKYSRINDSRAADTFQFTQAIGVACIILGTFLLFASHRFFKSSLFIFAFFTFTVITFIFLELHWRSYINFEEATISMMFGTISKLASSC